MGHKCFISYKKRIKRIKIISSSYLQVRMLSINPWIVLLIVKMATT